mmetsp:Transcript_21376/g.50244  ORF Transcript_21376/g.50244 Transcript_21376/m.50244 type:complete len:289 (+) Transcript_21376:679-1545(+)
MNPRRHGGRGVMDEFFHKGKDESLFQNDIGVDSLFLFFLAHFVVRRRISFQQELWIGILWRNSYATPCLIVPFLGTQRMGFISPVDVVGDHFREAQSLSTTFHFIQIDARLFGNGGSIVHGIFEAHVVRNAKDGKPKVHQHSLHGHTGQLSSTSMTALAGKGASNFAINFCPSTGLRKVVPKLLHAIRNAAEVGGRAASHGVGPVDIGIVAKVMYRVAWLGGVFPGSWWSRYGTNPNLHAIQEHGSFGNEVGNGLRGSSAGIVQDQDATIAMTTIIEQRSIHGDAFGT